MECPNCGQENRDVAQFCQHCGTSLTSSHEIEGGADANEVTIVEVVESPVSLETEEPVEETTVPALSVQEHAPPEAQVKGPEEMVESVETAEESIALEPGAETVIEEPVVADAADDAEDAQIEPAEAETEGEAPKAEQELEQEPELEPAPGQAEPLTEPVPVAEDKAPEWESEQDTVIKETAVEEKEVIGEPLVASEDEEALVPIDQEEETPPADDYTAEMEELVDADMLPWRQEPEPAASLELGTVLQGRYQVIELLATEGGETLYWVRDLHRCPQCGFAENSPDELFCVSCGAVMDRKPVAMMLERDIERNDEPVEAPVQERFSENDRAYWVWREAKAETSPLGGAEGPMRMTIGQMSDTGQVRELDEDSLFVLTMSHTYESLEDTIALFVVADGMGGHEGGEVASKIAIQTLTSALLHNVFTPELEGTVLSPQEIRDWMRQAGEAANDQVYLERQKRQNDMGTTLTAALLQEWTLYLAHVGDCRAYRWSEDGLEQLTTDHSIVASMIAAGTALPEEIYTHPQRSVIYRCVGDQPIVQVDTSVLSVSPGDRLVFCCDGLWEMIRDEGIEDVMLREPDPQRACETMVELANTAGGMDNISVIIVQL